MSDVHTHMLETLSKIIVISQGILVNNCSLHVNRLLFYAKSNPPHSLFGYITAFTWTGHANPVYPNNLIIKLQFLKHSSSTRFYLFLSSNLFLVFVRCFVSRDLIVINTALHKLFLVHLHLLFVSALLCYLLFQVCLSVLNL